MQITETIVRSDGRFSGSYIYVFVCEHLGQAVVKVGVSDFPFKRLDQIRQGCPFAGVGFATVHVYTRIAAFKIEAELLHSFEKWRTRGEWLSFNPADKPLFNGTLRVVLDRYKKQGWPLKVVKAALSMKMLESLPNQHRDRRKKYRGIQEFVRRCEQEVGLKNQFEGKTLCEQAALAKKMSEDERTSCNPVENVG